MGHLQRAPTLTQPVALRRFLNRKLSQPFLTCTRRVRRIMSRAPRLLTCAAVFLQRSDNLVRIARGEHARRHVSRHRAARPDHCVNAYLRARTKDDAAVHLNIPTGRDRLGRHKPLALDAVIKRMRRRVDRCGGSDLGIASYRQFGRIEHHAVKIEENALGSQRSPLSIFSRTESRRPLRGTLMMICQAPNCAISS